MLGASIVTLSGCSSTSVNTNITSNVQPTISTTTDNTTPQEKKTNYAVVVENDIAIIYDEIKSYVEYGHDEMWSNVKIDDDFNIDLPEGTHILKNCTSEDAKEYAKGLVSENGIVKTFDIEKEKTFVKVK